VQISDWIDLLKKITDGELDNVHPTFPSPHIYGMKVTKTGVNMLLTEQKYGAEMDLLEADIMFENSVPVNIADEKTIESYNRLMQYQKKTYVPKKSPKPKEKNVKSLFKKKKSKKKV